MSNIQARAEKVRANSIAYNEKVEKAYEDRELFKEEKLNGYQQKLAKLEKFRKMKRFEAKERKVDLDELNEKRLNARNTAYKMQEEKEKNIQESAEK